MTFLFLPGFLALISIPILLWLHLRQQRLKRVIVPSLMLWSKIPIPRRTERRRWLPITLLLLLHMLIAALISLALTHPHTINWLLNRKQHVAIIIDTSLSMQASDTLHGTRLAYAKERVRQRINSLTADDYVILITAGTQAHVISAGSMEHRATLLHMLDTIQASDSGADIGGALTLAQTMLAVDVRNSLTNEQRIVLVSDYAQPETIPVLNQSVEWIRIGEDSENRAIVALAIRPRVGTGKPTYSLYARFANYGATQITTPFRLFGDDRLRDTHYLNLLPDGEVEYTWDLPDGISVVRAEIDGQDVLTQDDIASIGVDQQRIYKTLLVSTNPAPLERILRIIPTLSLVTIEPAAYASSPLAVKADLTVFDGTLAGIDKWPTGGVLVIHPPADDSPLVQVSTTKPVSTSLYVTEEGHNLLNELNLDSINFGAIAHLEQQPPWAKPWLMSHDNVPLIMRGKTGQSDITMWTFDIRPLANRLVFPLLVARTVQDMLPQPLPASVLPGTTLTLHASPHADKVEMVQPDGTLRVLSEQPGGGAFRLNALTQPGVYVWREYTGNDILYEGHMAVNTGTPSESNVRVHPASLNAALKSVTLPPTDASTAQTILSDDQHPLWTWILLVAVGLLMVEWIYYTGLIRKPVVRKQ